MVNPRLQKAILEVVENQIRENNPPETKRTLDRLLKKGYSKDDAMKLIGRAVLGEIYKV
jgi:SOS response regulatory protein OraA/RecX